MIGNYLTDFFRGAETRKAKLEFIAEKTNDSNYKQPTYEGGAEGIAALEKVIRGLANE